MKRIQFNNKLLFIFIVLVAVLILFPSCLTPTVSSNSPHKITAMMDDGNSLIFHIQGTVAGAGKVVVQYWSTGDGPFVTAPVDTKGSAFSIEVMRLRPSTQYNYQVFLTQGSKSPVSQYQSTFITGPLPAGLKDARIQVVQGKPTYDLILGDFNCTNFNGAVALDGSGQIVWYYQNDNAVFTLAQEDNHNLVFSELGMVQGYRMKEIAPDGRTIHSVSDTLQNGTVSAPMGRWHHEMLLRPGNKVWTMGSELRMVNINGTDTLQTGDTIEEWDITKGSVTRLMSFFDILDPINDRGPDSNLKQGFFWAGPQNQYAGAAEDWTHSNSMALLPNGNILVSIRHLDEIIAIKPDFKGIDWVLGGKNSSFTFPDPSDRFYHQHYARMLPSGNILLFDNGNQRPAEQGGQYSRALELKLDFKSMQAMKVWEYRNKPDLFAAAVGSAVRLKNGNTVIDFGFDTVTTDNPPVFNVVEADSQGNPVAITVIGAPGKTIQYRDIPIESLNGEAKN